MSLPDSSTKYSARGSTKPAYDIYTVMLFIAFLALLLGCLLLYLELRSYGQFPYWKPVTAVWPSGMENAWAASQLLRQPLG